MRNKRKSSVIFRTALVLLCLVLFSAHLSSGMLAKYTFSSAKGGTAFPAKSDITITSTAAPDLAVDGTAEYAFNMENTGDVTVYYSVIVYPSSDSLTADQLARAFHDPAIGTVTGVYDSSTGAYTFADLGLFEPGEDVDLTLSFLYDDIVVNSTDPYSIDYSGVILNISAKAVQAD